MFTDQVRSVRGGCELRPTSRRRLCRRRRIPSRTRPTHTARGGCQRDEDINCV